MFLEVTFYAYNLYSKKYFFTAFVKYNETTAKIEIHLKNTGDKKYEPDKFGSKIIVIRKFGPKSSSYLIQNDKHHTIYNRAADLSKILNHFNIQIDNPLCVLNQDVSRSFLNSSNSNKKYTFFLKATQLEIIYEELRCATDNAGDIKLLIDEEKAVFLILSFLKFEIFYFYNSSNSEF